MKQLIFDIYWETINELEKIHKSKLLLSERIALERAIVKLESIKKILGCCDISPKPQ